MEEAADVGRTAERCVNRGVGGIGRQDVAVVGAVQLEHS
jgi:hypothetical protein